MAGQMEEQQGTRDVSHQEGIRKGEEVEETEGKEAGRADTGTQFESQRPKGTSDARDFSGVDPQDPDSGTAKG
jgi:hypothetical protein